MHQIVGKVYRSNGTMFTVLDAEPFPKEKVSDRYKEILGFEPGLLVAVGFRGVCIPNITQRGGVVRLTKVQVGDQTLDRPGAISKALGVKQPMVKYPLSEVT